MIIKIEKSGTLLISRPAGKEAASIILSSFKPQSGIEPIELDFTGVEVMGPAWLEEVLLTLRDKYGARVRCLPSANLSVVESLKIIESP